MSPGKVGASYQRKRLNQGWFGPFSNQIEVWNRKTKVDNLTSRRRCETQIRQCQKVREHKREVLGRLNLREVKKRSSNYSTSPQTWEANGAKSANDADSDQVQSDWSQRDQKPASKFLSLSALSDWRDQYFPVVPWLQWHQTAKGPHFCLELRPVNCEPQKKYFKHHFEWTRRFQADRIAQSRAVEVAKCAQVPHGV